MKKISTLLIGLFIFCLSASADVVDAARAEKIAQRWMGGASPVLSWDGLDTKSADAAPLFYVFNNPEGGWIMISAEDAMCPVLGYSDTGSFRFDNMPVNLRGWLEGYAKSIRELRKYNVKANAEAQQLWQTAGYRTKATGGKLLETASWDQDEPYNLLCPEVTENGRKYTAITGCVATAMSIVCRYHQWPEHGKGTIGGYSYTSDYRQTVKIDSYSIDSHNYDYSLMPLKYGNSATTAQKNAVAQLMHDNGVMVEAMYNYGSGTGAYSENIAHALHEHMYYSGNAHLAYRSEYQDSEWLRLIKGEIDANRPILYGGNDPNNGGHQFVCDGYDAKDYVHINWGWSGSSNGYFTLDLKISGSYTFNEYQDMVVGLEPDRDDSTKAAQGPISFYYYSGYSSYKGLTLTSGTVAGKLFTVNAGCLYNENQFDNYSGSVRCVLVDMKGDLKEVISDEKKVSISAGQINVATLNCNITKDLAYGDVVILQYKNGSGNWEKVRSYLDTSTSLVDSLPYIDAPYLVVADSYSAGDKFYLELASSSKAIKSYSWTYDGTTQKVPSVSLTAGTHTIVATITYSDSSKDVITATIEVK